MAIAFMPTMQKEFEATVKLRTQQHHHQTLERWCDTQVEGTCHSQPLQSNQIWHIIAKNISCYFFPFLPLSLSTPLHLPLALSLPGECVCARSNCYFDCLSLILYGQRVWGKFFLSTRGRREDEMTTETSEWYRMKKFSLRIRTNDSGAKRIHVRISGVYISQRPLYFRKICVICRM